MKLRELTLIILIIVCSTLVACGQSSETEMMTEGQQYLDDENYQGAVVIFKTILEQSPENMEARFGLGKGYLMMGKLDLAEKSFEKYARQNPYDKSLALEVGRLKLFQNEFSEAIEQLQSFVKTSPDSAEGYGLLGRAYWGSGNLDEAAIQFQKSLDVDPDLTSSRLALAQLKLLANDVDGAEETLAVLLERDPNSRDGLYFKAKMEGLRGDLKAYQATYKMIVENYPDDTYAKYIYGKGLIEQNEIDKSDKIAQELLTVAPNQPYGKKLQGMISYYKKDYEEAVNAFHEAVDIRPDPEGYFFLGMSYYGIGDLETAITQLRITAERAEKFVKAREMISLILLQQGRVNESIAEAQRVIKVDPENVVARIILGDAYTVKGDPQSALAQLKEITEKEPLFAEAFTKMGALHYAMGEMSESETALRGAVAAAPDKVRPRLVLSSFYLRNGDRDLAWKVLEDGLNGGKSDAALYSYMARMALLDKEPEKARNLLIKAKSKEPGLATPYLMLASLSLSEKKPEEALAEYNSLLEKREGYLKALLGKALILDALDRADEAKLAYQEAVKSGNLHAFMAYAGSLRKNGEVDGALVVLDDGLKLMPNNPMLIKLKAETLYSVKRYDDVLNMSYELEKTLRQPGLGLRTRTYLLMGEYDKALETGMTLKDSDTRNPAGYIILADIYRQAGRNDEWGRILAEGVKVCGPIPALLMDYSRYYYNEGDFDKALTYLDSVIKRNEKAYQAIAARGDIYLRLDREDEAVKSYNKALEVSDQYVPALNNLAMIYLKKSSTQEEALRLAYKAYLHMPWNPSVLDTFGYALAVNDHTKTAVSILEKAANVEPENNEINFHLGYAYHKAGLNDQAAAKLQMVAECKDCAHAENARKILNEIKGD